MDLSANKSQLSHQKNVPNVEATNLASNLKCSEFLKLIKEHPALYKVNHPDFKKIDPSNTAWSQISIQTGINGLFFV